MFALTLFIFVTQLFYGNQAMECGFSAARGHFDEIQRLLQNCVEIKNFDALRNNFSTSPEFVTRTDGPNVRNNVSSLESQSDEADDANPQVNTARIAQIRLRYPTMTDDVRTTLLSNRGEDIGQLTIPGNRNESFRAQTPIITIQPTNSNVSTVPDNSSDQDEDEDQDQTNVTNESEQSQETNGTVNQCIIRCLLEQINVLNETGFPDRQKLSRELLNKVAGRNVQNFFQDAVNDCYRQTDDKYLDSCEFSTELIFCLVEKGKANCNDWPAGIFSYAN